MQKRLFIAIKIIPEKQLTDIIQHLKHGLSRDSIKWVELNNMHLTLKFFGDVEISEITAINKVCTAIATNTNDFILELSGLGAFKSILNPQVLWVGIKRNKSLEELFISIQKNLQSINIKPDNKPFSPHLTIGRIKFIDDISNFRNRIGCFKALEFQSCKVDSFILYESILKPAGPIYKDLHKYALVTGT
jgi:RNA 2',3'-cyclic 3'-phosphodiesterase